MPDVVLRDTLAHLEGFLRHCKAHLSPEEWAELTRRIQTTNLAEGYTPREAWRPLDYLHYYWRRVPLRDRQHFLLEMLTQAERRTILHGALEETP